MCCRHEGSWEGGDPIRDSNWSLGRVWSLQSLGLLWGGALLGTLLDRRQGIGGGAAGSSGAEGKGGNKGSGLLMEGSRTREVYGLLKMGGGARNSHSSLGKTLALQRVTRNSHSSQGNMSTLAVLWPYISLTVMGVGNGIFGFEFPNPLGAPRLRVWPEQMEESAEGALAGSRLSRGVGGQ